MCCTCAAGELAWSVFCTAWERGSEGGLSLEPAQGWGQTGSGHLHPQLVLDPIRTHESLSNHPESNSCAINHDEVCAGSDSVLLRCWLKETSLNTGEDLLSKEHSVSKPVNFMCCSRFCIINSCCGVRGV